MSSKFVQMGKRNLSPQPARMQNVDRPRPNYCTPKELWARCGQFILEQEQKRAEIELLSNAKPDGTRCSVKGCVFPSFITGKCRPHYNESKMTHSYLGSSGKGMMMGVVQ